MSSDGSVVTDGEAVLPPASSSSDSAAEAAAAVSIDDITPSLDGIPGSSNGLAAAAAQHDESVEGAPDDSEAGNGEHQHDQEQEQEQEQEQDYDQQDHQDHQDEDGSGGDGDESFGGFGSDSEEEVANGQPAPIALPWKSRNNQVLVLTNAGKTVYSRFGAEKEMIGYMGVIQAIISRCECDALERIRHIEAGKYRFVFLLREPLYLLLITTSTVPIQVGVLCCANMPFWLRGV
jgi:hypothetical protein